MHLFHNPILKIARGFPVGGEPFSQILIVHVHLFFIINLELNINNETSERKKFKQNVLVVIV